MRSPSFSRKTMSMMISIAAVLAIGIGFAVFNNQDKAEALPGKAQPIRPVKIMQLTGAIEKEIRTFTGVVQAVREVSLAFRVGGPLVEMDVNIGQHVNQGDTIARIDARDFEINRMRLTAALKEAQAGLKAMKAGARAEDIASLEARLAASQVQLRDAKANFRRQKELLENNVTTQAAFDSSQAAFDTARANLNVAEQELKKARSGARIEDIQAAEAGIKRIKIDLRAAENALNDTRLKAPFDGYIGSKHVENYENVKDGDPIVTLLDASIVEVRSAVPEDVIIRHNDIASIFCTLDAYQGKTFPAVVKELGRKTEQANQSYPLTVSLSTDEAIIAQPGMAASLTLELNTHTRAGAGFSVPASAVFSDARGQSCVWRLDKKTMRVVKVPVTIGVLFQDAVQITSGLFVDDQIVIAGARFLSDNQEVRILNRNKGGGS